jgi:hypothetical protein
MKTQILDCDIIINGNNISVINSEMKIELDWDINIEKKEDSALVKIELKNLKGYVSYFSSKPDYKKTIRIEFNTDSSWLLKSKYETITEVHIEPVKSIIDFDSKCVNIEY